MKLVCSNRKWQRFEKNRAQGLETYHPVIPQFPLWINTTNNGSRHWSQGIPYQILIHDWAMTRTFLVKKWTVFIFGDILFTQVVPENNQFLTGKCWTQCHAAANIFHKEALAEWCWSRVGKCKVCYVLLPPPQPYSSPFLGRGPVGDNDLWHHHIGEFSPFFWQRPR